MRANNLECPKITGSPWQCSFSTVVTVAWYGIYLSTLHWSLVMTHHSLLYMCNYFHCSVLIVDTKIFGRVGITSNTTSKYSLLSSVRNSLQSHYILDDILNLHTPSLMRSTIIRGNPISFICTHLSRVQVLITFIRKSLRMRYIFQSGRWERPYNSFHWG